jgi:uncharacterized protein YjbI with pentapeptide repeats
MPRSFPRRYHTPAEPEKPFEALAEQAKQTRTQFFVYLATVTFLLVTVLSITDKQLLLNNSLVTLPLINVSVPPKYVLIFGPALLLITFCNLHIHWFRYVKEVEAQGLNAPGQQNKLFPFMIYQALYHRQEGLVGFLESTLAMQALFVLLVMVQGSFVWQILKFHQISFSVSGLLMLGISIVLNIYWLNKSYIDLPRNLNVALLHKIKNIVISLYAIFFACVTLDLGLILPHLTVTTTILSPPPDLLNTPIVTPFLEKLNKEALAEANQQQQNIDQTKTPATEAHDVFDGVYWLDLRGKSLAWANLNGSILLKTNFEGADLNHARLINTDLRHSNLKDVKLNNTDLSNANLNHADLWGAKLNNTDLSNANLNHANLYTAQLNNFANLQHTKLNHANLTSAELNYADLWDAKINEARLSSANLNHTNLYEAQLKYTNLYEADFNDSRLEAANLKRVYFEETWDGKTNAWIPVYGVGGESLCQAKTLAYAQMDDWLFKKLKTIKACNGKLKGVNTPPPELRTIVD